MNEELKKAIDELESIGASCLVYYKLSPQGHGNLKGNFVVDKFNKIAGVYVVNSSNGSIVFTVNMVSLLEVSKDGNLIEINYFDLKG